MNAVRSTNMKQLKFTAATARPARVLSVLAGSSAMAQRCRDQGAVDDKLGRDSDAHVVTVSDRTTQ